MLLQPDSELVTREVIGYSEAGGPGDIQIPSKWNNLVQEFHDIFDPPGMPVGRVKECQCHDLLKDYLELN